MAGSYVQLIILMRNFGKFQSGILVLIICQRHIAICFSHGLRFHCLHIVSNTCIFWVNIVPTSGSTNYLKIPSQNKRIVQQINRKQLRRESNLVHLHVQPTHWPLHYCASQFLVKWVCFFKTIFLCHRRCLKKKKSLSAYSKAISHYYFGPEPIKCFGFKGPIVVENQSNKLYWI